MAGQDLQKLLKGANPRLSEGKHYVATVPEGQMMSLAGYLSYIAGIFREEEGLSVVFTEELLAIMESLSEKKIAGPFALITLRAESDLLAIGFLAAMTSSLAKEKIAANAFSAYYHDHLLVPYEKKDAALACLKKLQKT